MPSKRRTSMIRKRAGQSDLMLARAWIAHKSFSALRSPGSTEIGINAEVTLDVGADVLEGDLLSDNQTALVLFVYQLQFAANTKTALCLEVSTDSLKRKRASVADAPLDVAWFFSQSAGADRDAQTGSRVVVRLRRTADVLEGDIIENSTLGKSWFVYEVLNEQLTKLAHGLEISGFTLTRQRDGLSDALIAPVWFRAQASGTRKVFIDGEDVPITASVLMPPAADVLPRDTLTDADGNVYYVYQVLPGLALKAALVQEPPSIVEDGFRDGVLGSFWTEESPGNWSEGSAGLILQPPRLTTNDPNAAAWLFQRVFAENFDVYVKVDIVDEFEPPSGGEYVMFLGVKYANGDGVYLEFLTQPGNVIRYRRRDHPNQVSAPQTTTETVAYLRVGREGTHIFTQIKLGEAFPTVSGWSSLASGVNPVGGSGPVEIGIGGYLKATSDPADLANLFFYFFRRWLNGTPIPSNVSRVVKGAQMVGVKNGVNKVFSFPEALQDNSESVYWNGQLQVRGDDYTVDSFNNTLTFAVAHPAPASGDSLIVDYLV